VRTQFMCKSEGKGQTIEPYLAVLKDRVLQHKQTNSVSGQTQAHCVSPETETEHTYGEDS